MIVSRRRRAFVSRRVDRRRLVFWFLRDVYHVPHQWRLAICDRLPSVQQTCNRAKARDRSRGPILKGWNRATRNAK
jgi:hypothetical protein